MAEPKTELCTVRIVFPVKSDDYAMDCKKKIKAVVDEIPEAQIQFSFMTMPSH